MASKLVSRFSIAVKIAVLSSSALLVACSSSSGPRDRNWGSDIGRDAGTGATLDTPEAVDEAGEDDASDASDAAVDMDGAEMTAVSDAADASGGETMDADAMTAQYTGGPRANEGAHQ